MCRQWRGSYAGELSTEEWKRIIGDLKKNGIKNIHFTGGEPLLRKDIRELVAYSSSNGFATGLTTNGMLLKKEILEELINAGLRSIALSLDALGAEYNSIRGVTDSFEKVEKALFTIAEMKKKKKIDGYVNFTLMKGNMSELKKVKSLVDEVSLRLHVSLLDKNSSIFAVDENKNAFWINEDTDGEALRDVLDYLRHEKIKNPRALITNFPAIDFIMEYFKDPRQERIPCVSSQDRIIISPGGELLGGCMSMGSFGRILDTSLAELQKEERYKKAKRNMFYKKCDGCSCGYLFNIRCLPGLAFEDLLIRVKNFCKFKTISS